MKDWMIRAIKTFVQAFFGVLIPAVCAMLNNGWPESWDKIWVILAPTVAAALAAAIAAVWNILLEAMDPTQGGQHLNGWQDPGPDADQSAAETVGVPIYDDILQEFHDQDPES